MYDKVVETIKGFDPARAKRYETYFDKIRPKTQKEIFRRGLFSLASVHTTWSLNCALYAELWDMKWLKDIGLLRQRILDSRAGLVNGRVRAISAYASLYWQFAVSSTRRPVNRGTSTAIE